MIYLREEPLVIKRQKSKGGATKVTFALPIDEAPAETSVVGDFNNWDPMATPMKKRSNGTRSASVEIGQGEVVAFRYLADGGHWFNEAETDIDDVGNSQLAA